MSHVEAGGGGPADGFQRPDFSSAAATSCGMYVSSCLARTSVAPKTPSGRISPTATIPWPSRKQVGKNADVADEHARPSIRDAEAGRGTSLHRQALQAPLLDKAANADDLAQPRRVGDQLRRRLKEDETAPECDKGQRCGTADTDAADQDNQKATAFPCHDLPPRLPIRETRGSKAAKLAFACLSLTQAPRERARGVRTPAA